MALPPGRAMLFTVPVPTGSTAWANTIGRVRVASCKACRGRADAGDQHVRGERDKLFRILTQAREIAAAPAHVDAHVAPDHPARFLQPLRQRG